MGCVVVSLTLILVDHFSNNLDSVRSRLTVLVSPVYVVANLPSQSVQNLVDLFSDKSVMQEKIARLENELLLQQAATAKMASLMLENKRLRDLLGSAAKLQENIVIAEIVGIDPDPQKHEIIIDKGTIDDAYPGQPILDAHGLIGQIIAVSQLNSRVLLISDHSHSVPVQVARSNLRLIAQGTGATNKLELMHVQSTADIQPGDLLISSGLGGRFPVGYPVGIVDKVEQKPGKPFSEVTAIPSAKLDRSRHLLLVFTEGRMANRYGNDG